MPMRCILRRRAGACEELVSFDAKLAKAAAKLKLKPDVALVKVRL